jgi:hypothetical protein
MHLYKILFLGPILKSKMVVYKFTIPGACILAPVLGGHSGGRREKGVLQGTWRWSTE